mmetsp:Transcript_18769/g.48145  ORF Transcript_18769/g.48145 Transcript_18769/m.48145 type:complete len:309 (-) Transcript_18769:2369-3295(-)
MQKSLWMSQPSSQASYPAHPRVSRLPVFIGMFGIGERSTEAPRSRVALSWRSAGGGGSAGEVVAPGTGGALLGDGVLASVKIAGAWPAASAAAWRPAAAGLAASCVADVASAAADGSASPTASATLPSLASMDSAVSGATAAARLCFVTSAGGLEVTAMPLLGNCGEGAASPSSGSKSLGGTLSSATTWPSSSPGLPMSSSMGSELCTWTINAVSTNIALVELPPASPPRRQASAAAGSAASSTSSALTAHSDGRVSTSIAHGSHGRSPPSGPDHGCHHATSARSCMPQLTTITCGSAVGTRICRTIW